MSESKTPTQSQTAAADYDAILALVSGLQGFTTYYNGGYPFQRAAVNGNGKQFKSQIAMLKSMCDLLVLPEKGDANNLAKLRDFSGACTNIQVYWSQNMSGYTNSVGYFKALDILNTVQPLLVAYIKRITPPPLPPQPSTPLLPTPSTSETTARAIHDGDSDSDDTSSSSSCPSFWSCIAACFRCCRCNSSV